MGQSLAIPRVIPEDWKRLDLIVNKIKMRLGRDGNPTFTGITLSNTGLHLLDTNASHDLIIAPGSNLTADRTLTLTTGDSDRTIILSGNPTLDDWFDQSVKVAASPTFSDLTISTPVNIYALSHDSFADYDANKHIDHTGVTLTAGTGLTGGGDISANRTFAVDGVLEDLDILGANAADSEFLVGTGAGALAWESGATVRTSIGLGIGDSPQFTNLTLTGDLLVSDSHGVMAGTGGTDAALLLKAGSDAGGGVIDYVLLTLEGASENLVFQVTNGSSITFSPGNITTSTGTINFNDENLTTNGTLTASNYAAANLLTACATNAGALDFSAAGKTLTIENNTIVSQDYTSDATPTFNQVTLGIDPTNVDHSVTKSYADALVAGAFWEDVDVGTVANVDLSTALEAGDTIDDYVLVEGDRVLVKEQTDQTENGLYVVPASGAASRTADADTAAEIEGKKCIPLNGALTKHRFYFCITGDITLGVTDIKFAEVTMMTAHNTLSALQGGTTDQYYHLTLAEHTALIKIPALTYAADSMIKVTAEDTYAIRTMAEVRTDLGLVIGTNVLAEQAIGIANDNLLEVDDADAADTDYARFTANGLQGRDATEVKTDLGLVIGTNVQAHDAELDSLAALSYAAASFVKMTGVNTFALRTIGETADDLEATIDHDNLANGGAHDYAYISGNDVATGVTAAELEELSDGSETTLHTHDYAAAFGRPVILTPQSNCGPASNFATQDTIAGGSTPNEVVSVLDFDADASEYADFKFILPSGYAGGGLTVTVIFSMTSDHDEGTPHKVRWEIGFARIDNDGIAISADHAYAFNGVSATVPSVLTEVSYATITFTDGADMDSLAAGEMAILRIYRDHDHADDNATGDAELQMIQIKET